MAHWTKVGDGHVVFRTLFSKAEGRVYATRYRCMSCGKGHTHPRYGNFTSWDDRKLQYWLDSHYHPRQQLGLWWATKRLP